MAITANTTYFVRRKGSTGNLGYLNIYGNSYTGDTQPIKLWEKVSTDPMQKWRFDANPESGAFLCTMCDLTRAINMYSTSTPNCTIWAKANNATDGLVKIVEHASGYYYIRLVNRNLYLTATSTANGTQVTWAAQNPGSSTQLWEFIKEGGSSGSSGTAPSWNLISPPTSINNVDIMATYNAPLAFTGGYYTLKNVPDKLCGGIDNNCIMHKGSGFKANIDNFQTSCSDIIDVIADAVEVMYGHRNFPAANICYYLFGEYDADVGIHHGVDLAIGENSDIKALISGTVRSINPADGKVVIDNEDNQTCSCYYHMNTITVGVGDTVTAGVTKIGTEGRKGRASGPHLHFEIRKLGKEVGADPAQYDYNTALTSIVPYGFMKKAVEIYNYNH